jgi:Tol biopolymer transport system component
VTGLLRLSAVVASVAAISVGSALGISNNGQEPHGAISVDAQVGHLVVASDGGLDLLPVVETPDGLQGQNATGIAVDGRVGSPAISPDGKSLAFVAMTADGSDLVVSDLDGSRRENVTSSPDARETGPAWSPDGGRLAYERTDAEGRTDLWLLDVVTGRQQQLTSGDDLDAGADWSPDGTHVIYFRRSHETGRSDLYLFDVAHGTTRQLTDTPDQDESSPSFGPDGTSIAYLVPEPATRGSSHDDPTRGARRSLYVTTPDGAPRLLTSSPGLYVEPTWLSEDVIALAEIDFPSSRVLTVSVAHPDQMESLWAGSGLPTFAWWGE